MPATRTEEVRDASGKLLAIRVFQYDGQGRAFTADVPVNDISNLDPNAAVLAVVNQLASVAAASSMPPGQVLSDDAVEAVVVAAGGSIAAGDS